MCHGDKNIEDQVEDRLQILGTNNNIVHTHTNHDSLLNPKKKNYFFYSSRIYIHFIFVHSWNERRGKKQPEYICAVEQSDDTQTRQMPDENRW